MKDELNAYHHRIIRILHEKMGHMTAFEISRLTGISYVTVQRYLEELQKMDVVIKEQYLQYQHMRNVEKDKIEKWSLNYKKIFHK